MRILGLDPGTARIGFALLDGAPPAGLQLVTCGCIHTAAGKPVVDRLLEVHRDLTEIVERYRPAVAAVESLFFNQNVTTAMSVAQTRGVLLLTLGQAGVPVVEYTPLAVKKAVAGYGRAVKSQVQAMVTRILRLQAPPKPDDAADAVALALCHRFNVRTHLAGRAGIV